MKLNGNTILITGGSAGIGLALAKEFAKLGNKIVITGRNPDKLANAVKSIGEGCSSIICDASDPKAVSTLGKEIAKDHPDVNVLINNAGTFIAGDLSKGADDLHQLNTEITLNFSGVVWTTSALIDQLRKNTGTIINVTSGLAFVPFPLSPIYCATKAAIHSYTISLRSQLEDKGVEVIELAPPAVKTELTADMPDTNDFPMLTTDELVSQTIAGLRKGVEEICPGQAKQLRFMSRLAPGFINRQLGNAAKKMMSDA